MADRIVVVAATAPMVQVEDFPEGCARSCKGALHLRPGGTKVVTEDELAHLQANHPKVGAVLRVVDTTSTKAKPAAKPKAPKLMERAVKEAEGRGAARGEAAKPDSQPETAPGRPEGRDRRTSTPPSE